MNPKIVHPSDPLLREVMPHFEGDPRSLRSLASAMWLIMRHNSIDNYNAEARAWLELSNLTKVENGLGLAAPQVGQRARMFVMKQFMGVRFADALVCINPEIIARSEVEITDDEGCLTWPRKRVTNIKRARSIEASWTDLRGKRRRHSFFNVVARCFQHELDHLNGKVIFQMGDQPC